MESRKSPKLLWLDIGLVNFAAGNQREVFGAKDIMDVWKGHLAEQLVGQELLTLSDTYGTVRSFWVRNAKGSEAEVDFVCNIQSILIPIEVKAGLNSKLRSLHSFVDKCHKTQNSASYCLAVRIWSGPYSSDTVITPAGNSFVLFNVPFYLIGALNLILKPYLNEECSIHRHNVSIHGETFCLISRLENGKSDIQLSTLFRIFEGLGRKTSLMIV